MNKSELVNEVANNAKVSRKVAETTVATIVESISSALASGDKVQLIGFGTFETRNRASRKGRNPLTGEELKVEAKTVPAFKAGKALKEIVNK